MFSAHLTTAIATSNSLFVFRFLDSWSNTWVSGEDGETTELFRALYALGDRLTSFLNQR
jgi:hypothetical protein